MTTVVKEHHTHGGIQRGGGGGGGGGGPDPPIHPGKSQVAINFLRNKLFLHRISYAKLFEVAKNPCSNHEIQLLFEHGF